jgi:hypothetical protein
MQPFAHQVSVYFQVLENYHDLMRFPYLMGRLTPCQTNFLELMHQFVENLQSPAFLTPDSAYVK